MAKRNTGFSGVRNSHKRSHSNKTKKRKAIKHAMLARRKK